MPVDRPSESVTEDIFEPKILERNWPPRLPSGELVAPDSSEPGLERILDSVVELFAGLVTRLNI
jgi:hypothetical protein